LISSRRLVCPSSVDNTARFSHPCRLLLHDLRPTVFHIIRSLRSSLSLQSRAWCILCGFRNVCVLIKIHNGKQNFAVTFSIIRSDLRRVFTCINFCFRPKIRWVRDILRARFFFLKIYCFLLTSRVVSPAHALCEFPTTVRRHEGGGVR